MLLNINRIKLILTFLIFSTVLIITFILVDIFFYSKKFEKSLSNNMHIVLEEKEKEFKNIFVNAKDSLLSVSESNIFKEFLKSPEKQKYISSLMLSIAKDNKNIMQFRYIDNTGHEKIRIDRSLVEVEPSVLSQKELQDKSSRYYFTNSREKETNEIWFSNLDLNIENGKVQVPYNPTLRAILTVRDNEGFKGILIINYFMEGFLEKVLKSDLYEMILVNEGGHYLVHYNNFYNWSKYNDRQNYNIKNDIFFYNKNIIKMDFLKTDKYISKKLDIETPEKLILIMKIKRGILRSEQFEKLEQYIIESFIIIISFIVLALLFSRLLQKVFLSLQDTKKYNEMLNKKVELKTEKLEKLNKKLTSSKDSLEKAEEISNIGNWKLVIKGKKLSLSNNLKKLLGYGQKEKVILSSFIKNNIHHHDKKRLIKKFVMLKKERKNFKTAFKIKRKDNKEIRYFNCNVEFIFKNKKLIEIVGTLQDVTDISLMQNELLILRQAVEQAPISFVITDEKGGIEYVNPHFLEVTSYTLDEVIGQNPRILKSEHMQSEDYEKLWEKISNGKTWSGTFKNIDKNGKIFWELAFISPVYSQVDKKIKKYLAIKQEVTQEVYLKQELKDKENLMISQSRHAAMGEMISMIAHQWKQPLATISMGTNNILADIELELLDEESLKNTINDITMQIDYLSNTIDDFRDFFKPQRERELIKFSSIVEDTLSIIGKTLKNKNIKTQFEYKYNEEILIFKKEFIQVLINLFKNSGDAFDLDKSDKKIQILEYRKRDKIVIEFSDNAGGIPENIISRVFEPYFTTKNELTGTGLGLYMSKTIIEKQLKGKLEVFNKFDGACFKITLPL